MSTKFSDMQKPGHHVEEPLHTTLAALVATIAGGFHEEPAVARVRLEQTLAALPGVRSIRLRGCRAPFDQPPPGCTQHRLALPGLEDEAAIELVTDAVDAEGARLLEFFRQVAIVVAPIVRAERMASAIVHGAASRGARPLLGTSDSMRSLRAQIEKVARTDFSVLIEGESGAGKELVARQIHESSRRRKGPFVAVNCAALVETLVEAELFGIEDRTATGVRGRRGKFEQADGGTLFLDEIGDLAAMAQAKLLRVLQEWCVERVGGQGTQRVDVRVVAATNRPLTRLVDEGRFRLDLYHRLNGLEVRVPPLRVRPGDIPELVTATLGRLRHFSATRVSPAAMDAMQNYGWPGNVRELERVVERAVAFADGEVIQVEDLPPHVAGTYVEVLMPALEANETLRAWGSRYVQVVLGRCRNNKRMACRRLGISYHTLQAHLRAWPHGRPALSPTGEPGNHEGAAGARRCRTDEAARLLDARRGA